MSANIETLYCYRIHWSEEDAEFVGLCAELPGLSWLAPTPDEAFAGIRRVVAEAVADMRAEGELVPEALATHRYSGRFMVRVPPETHRRIAMEAAEAGVSMNRVISERLSYAAG